MNLSWEEVERYRDRTFRRKRSLAVHGEKTAMAFISEVGFCTAFSAHEHLPCLWVAVCGQRNPRMPHHTHSDYAIGVTWGLKDSLPDARKVFYARLLHGKPTLISLEYLPYFYRVFGPQSGAVPGTLSLTEQGILDWLATHPPQPTYQLRLHADFRGRLHKARFEKAMARLQESLYVMKTKTVYEPKFTYYWGLVEREFPKAVRKARGLSREAALGKILRKYFDVVLCARRRDLVSIFRGAEPGLLNEVLEDMTRPGNLRAGEKIDGKDASWYCGIMVR
ncbi:MAG: hypothetical protein ACM3NO_02820 [Deltaproteobacteria bacterium]